MNPHSHIINPLPVLLAVALAGIMATPGGQAQADESAPDPNPSMLTQLAPALAVVAVTAGLVLVVALKGAGFGVAGPLVVLGLAAATLVAYAMNPMLFGGGAA